MASNYSFPNGVVVWDVHGGAHEYPDATNARYAGPRVRVREGKDELAVFEQQHVICIEGMDAGSKTYTLNSNS